MEFKPFKIGKYLLLEKLATGGMAEVYRAKASGAGGFEKQLAIKRILPTYSQNEEFRRMFEYEARLSSMLTHSNIVQIYDFVKSGETYLLAMEYVDGKNLRQFVNKAKKINFSVPVEFGAFVINEVCKGLEYAHKKKDDLNGRSLNIIHRDMSPQNIMLSYDGAVKIVDFGIAKAKDRVDETRSGVIKGKFGYMSPEQANGESVDHRTDIFSTGIILFELLTGKRLFASENDMATLKLIQECVIPTPSRLNPKITSELERILMKALTREIKLRYQDAGIFHRNLQEYQNKYFPSFTQKDAESILQRVFREEIELEKRRFEQIHRQSIPFSQGDVVKSEADEFGDIEEALEGSITKSEAITNSGVTFIDEDVSIASGRSGSGLSAPTGSNTAQGSGGKEPLDGETQVEPVFVDDDVSSRADVSIPTLNEIRGKSLVIEEDHNTAEHSQELILRNSDSTHTTTKVTNTNAGTSPGPAGDERMPVLTKNTPGIGSRASDKPVEARAPERRVVEPPVERKVVEPPPRRSPEPPVERKVVEPPPRRSPEPPVERKVVEPPPRRPPEPPVERKVVEPPLRERKPLEATGPSVVEKLGEPSQIHSHAEPLDSEDTFSSDPHEEEIERPRVAEEHQSEPKPHPLTSLSAEPGSGPKERGSGSRRLEPVSDEPEIVPSGGSPRRGSAPRKEPEDLRELILREQTGSENRRRERSISAITDMSRAGDSEVTDQRRKEGSLSLVSLGQERESGPLQTDRTTASRRNDYYPEREDYIPKKRNAVVSFVIFCCVLGGTVYLYRLYLDGRIRDLMRMLGNSTESAPTPVAVPEPSKVAKTDPAPAPERRPGGGCTIRIDSDPPNAKVIINGKDRGTTSATISAPCDEAIDITLRKDGYESISENVVMKEKAGRIYKTLREIPMGTLALTLNRRAMIYIEGNLVGEAMADKRIEISVRANKKNTVQFVNEILGINTVRELAVEKDQILERTIRLEESSAPPKRATPSPKKRK